MKKQLKFREIDFEVDIEINKTIYSKLTSDSEFYVGQYSTLNFYLTHRKELFSNELIEFLNLTGIDWTKENEFFCFSQDNLIIIEGWFDIVGLVQTDKAASYYWDNTFGTTNIFFRNDARHGIRTEFQNLGTFRIEFAIVIPLEIVNL